MKNHTWRHEHRWHYSCSLNNHTQRTHAYTRKQILTDCERHSESNLWKASSSFLRDNKVITHKLTVGPLGLRDLHIIMVWLLKLSEGADQEKHWTEREDKNPAPLYFLVHNNKWKQWEKGTMYHCKLHNAKNTFMKYAFAFMLNKTWQEQDQIRDNV